MQFEEEEEEEEEGLSLLRERGFPNLKEELKEGGRSKEERRGQPLSLF